MKNLLVAQSGGPTAAINATVAGVVKKALDSGSIDKIYAGLNGIKGIMEERFVEIGERLRSDSQSELLKNTPAAALGSCRLKLKGIDEDEASYKKIYEIFKKYNIGYFVYIGGNDSMDTVLKLSQYFERENVTDIKVMGAPKTIDNDLTVTDHTPGFGSAAKYIATTFSEIGRDCGVYDIPAVTVVEVMGRNAGWLTAASALAHLNGGIAPQLIYLPEVTFSLERFIEDVKKELCKSPAVVVAVSEGIRDESGNYAAESYQSGAVDVFGHKYLSGTAKFLSDVVKQKIGCKTRSIELNLMQRCASHIASKTDIEESFALGAKACELALSGHSGEMSIILRKDKKEYEAAFSSAHILLVANKEKTVPREFINEAGNGVTEALLDYLKPLIVGEVSPHYENGIPMHFVI